MTRAFEVAGLATVLACALAVVFVVGGWPLVVAWLGVQVPLGCWVGRRLRCQGGGQ